MKKMVILWNLLFCLGGCKDRTSQALLAADNNTAASKSVLTAVLNIEAGQVVLSSKRSEMSALTLCIYVVRRGVKFEQTNLNENQRVIACKSDLRKSDSFSFDLTKLPKFDYEYRFDLALGFDDYVPDSPETYIAKALVILSVESDFQSAAADKNGILAKVKAFKNLNDEYTKTWHEITDTQVKGLTGSLSLSRAVSK